MTSALQTLRGRQCFGILDRGESRGSATLLEVELQLAKNKGSRPRRVADRRSRPSPSSDEGCMETVSPGAYTLSDLDDGQEVGNVRSLCTVS